MFCTRLYFHRAPLLVSFTPSVQIDAGPPTSDTPSITYDMMQMDTYERSVSLVLCLCEGIEVLKTIPESTEIQIEGWSSASSFQIYLTF